VILAPDLLVGIVGRPVGLKGEVEVDVVSDDPRRFAPGSVMSVRGRAMTIRTVRRNRKGTVVAFVEVSDRTAAEALHGAELVVPATKARVLGAHEYWDHDLLGCEVVTTDGRNLGPVGDVMHGPAGDILVVGTHLIPLAEGIVVAVQPRARITIDAIPGLLDP
jgi:16S rRNA processing protein RimM